MKILTYTNNYEKLWIQPEKDILKWNYLNLSLMGRIAVVKMNILLILFFQTIPITKEFKQFDMWQKKLSKFV